MWTKNDGRYLIASLEKYFYYYVAINYIEELSDWDTFEVENMSYCKMLKSLELI